MQAGMQYTPDDNPMLLDGSALDPMGNVYEWFQLCRTEDCYDITDIRFTPCNPEDYRHERHTIEFEGGRAVLEFRKEVRGIIAGTEPGAFVGASGELDGQSFTQTEYWKLVYNPRHHHVIRNFGVFFDEPIGSACGIKVENVDPFENDPTVSDTTVHTINCDLSNIEERAVTSQLFEQP
jgi:hypothetical protein